MIQDLGSLYFYVTWVKIGIEDKLFVSPFCPLICSLYFFWIKTVIPSGLLDFSETVVLSFFEVLFYIVCKKFLCIDSKVLLFRCWVSSFIFLIHSFVFSFVYWTMIPSGHPPILRLWPELFLGVSRSLRFLPIEFGSDP